MNFNALRQTPVFDCLSVCGKRMFQPNGIYYWTNRAKTESKINGTIGTAFGRESDILENGRSIELPYYLTQVSEYINLPPEKVVTYAPIAGVPKFRELWKKWIIHKGLHSKQMPSGPRDIGSLITTPVVCHGITNAIYIASRMFLNPGDQIITPNKRWGNYNAVLKLQNELIPTSFQFFKGSEFNLQGLKEKMLEVAKTQHHVAVILNFPNNPTGYCPTTVEMKAIRDLLIEIIETTEKPVIALCDDAYEGYVYSDQVSSNSIFYELVNLHPFLLPLKLDGTSKEMLMYGGRIACVTMGLHEEWLQETPIEEFDAEWTNKVQAMIRSTISTSNHCFQEILIKLFESGFDKIEQNRKSVIDHLQERYDTSIASYTKYSPKMTTLDPGGGGFFIFMNVTGISATNLADYLMKEYQVGLFPNENKELGINGLRIAYCSIPVEQIDDTFKAIRDAIETFPKDQYPIKN